MQSPRRRVMVVREGELTWDGPAAPGGAQSALHSVLTSTAVLMGFARRGEAKAVDGAVVNLMEMTISAAPDVAPGAIQLNDRSGVLLKGGQKIQPRIASRSTLLFANRPR